MELPARRTRPTITYSKRSRPAQTESSPRNKPCESDSILETPPEKKVKRSSIQAYFKPLISTAEPSGSSSPTSSQSVFLYTIDGSSPFSSPSGNKLIPDGAALDALPRRPRRLMTKIIPIDFDSEKDHIPPTPGLIGKDRKRLPTYTQSRFIMGGPRECAGCFMTWDSAIEADNKEHDRYHDAMTKFSAAKKPPYIRSILPYGPKSLMFGVDRRATSKWRTEGMKAMRILNNAIGGSMDEIVERLWMDIPDPLDISGGRRASRYKIYIYTEDSYIMSILLVERALKGSVGIEYPCEPSGNQDDSCENDQGPRREYPIVMIFDRIWTIDGHRRKGWATRLADFARQDFINGLNIPKSEVAFSPTLPGGQKFATTYCRGVFSQDSYLVSIDTVEEANREKRKPDESVNSG